VAAQTQQLRVSQIVAQRERLLDLIDQLLTSPPSGPLLRLSAASPSLVEGPGQLSDTLAAGDYSLRLSGVATGPGGGYLTFAVRPVASAAIPEPAAWALMLAGFGLTGAALRRRSSWPHQVRP